MLFEAFKPKDCIGGRSGEPFPKFLYNNKINFNLDMAVETKQRGINGKYDGVAFLVYKDILNGYNYSRVMKKIKDGGYDEEANMKVSNLNVGPVKSIYNKALDMLKVDSEQVSSMRELFYQRYEKLYQDAMEAQDRSVALNCLNSVCKFAGLMADKIDITSKGTIDIKFGFSDNNKTETN